MTTLDSKHKREKRSFISYQLSVTSHQLSVIRRQEAGDRVVGCWGFRVLGCWGVGVLGCWGFRVLGFYLKFPHFPTSPNPSHQ
ncbi:MAG: hypothetical protein EWV58_15570 [Microcystis aeruginosa Ma_MB_F_20061100_S19]|nr:MAG: hypothetical protein EWV58_15570 [Microcystis aeruginosa Ma_MB_F_20061100_S19]TRU16584.1 MAG: hypothetical protein EWV59_01500 [Microcystis aeruginosa Ma_MB_F_20061100_S19D]